MTQTSTLAPGPARNRGLLLLLHLCVFACSALASPIVVLTALTMLLALFSFFTTPGAEYAGGGFALLLLFVFLLTPLCAVLHLLGVFAVGLRRSTRMIWVFTGGYIALAWIACLVGPDAAHSLDDVARGRSLRPLYLFIAIPSVATLVAAVLHGREHLPKNTQA